MKDITPAILEYFKEICHIPRPSKKEEKICAYIKDFAQSHQLSWKQDATGNILVGKPASGGREHLQTAVLQSHVDMVCEKDKGVRHNFEKSPVEYYTDGDWMKARGTTLGADDGIGMAASLAVLADKTLTHGPLEVLFTVDEETGLTGAGQLESDFIKGNILINLDSEDEGELFIGCAGGITTTATFRYTEKETPTCSVAYKMGITGLAGGHSGDDINKGRGNAILIMNRILLNASSFYGISLSRFEGGGLHNAIPREASAIIVVDSGQADEFETYCTEEAQMWKETLEQTSPGFQFTVQRCELPSSIIDIVSQSCLLQAIVWCPSEVIEMSRSMPELVSTSSNIASVKFKGGKKIVVVTSQRSDNEQSKRKLVEQVCYNFQGPNITVKTTNDYPSWTPNLQSPILEITRTAYRDLYGKEAVVRAIHAGLECGLFLKKYPDLDMISFGPTIKEVHSPNEKLYLPSVKLFANLLLEVLNRIPVKQVN
jgi:dipeptidase D